MDKQNTNPNLILVNSSTVENTIINNPDKIVNSDKIVNRSGISDPRYLAHLRANFKDYRLAHPQLDKDTARKNFYREWKDNSNN